jgi:protein gp37
MHPDWVRSIRDQCVSAGVPFFFKQWGGEWGPYEFAMVRIGKGAAGRLLDGRTWDGLPGVNQ